MLRYTGGKGRMLKHILPLLPESKVYVEPYFGSGAVFFAKKPSQVEIINDRDDIIYAVYKALQDKEATAELHRRLRLGIASKRLFLECVDVLNRYRGGEKIPYVDVAFAAIYYNLYDVNKSFKEIRPSSFGVGPKSVYEKFASKSNIIAKLWHCARRVRNAIIMCDDALLVMQRFDTADTLFYIDPPYITETASYAHDTDHEALVGFLLSMRGKAILSCYYHEVYEPLLANGWKMRTFELRFNNYNFKEYDRRRQEVLLISPNISICRQPSQPTLF